MPLINDPHLRVEVIDKTAHPSRTAYLGLHTCYSEGYVYDGWQAQLDRNSDSDDLTAVKYDRGLGEDFDTKFTEDWCGEKVVEKLLKGNRGHFSPIEHGMIVFAIGGYPHSVMQQITRHRVAVGFSVQSGRYTGKRIYEIGKVIDELDSLPEWVLGKVDSIFYNRPAGLYSDRDGKSYEYTANWREEDLSLCAMACLKYYRDIERGKSEEHARGMIPFDIRQNWVASYNPRSLAHTLDLRAKRDAQLEVQDLSERLFAHFKEWMPEVAVWYEENRLHKARLAP